MYVQNAIGIQVPRPFMIKTSGLVFQSRALNRIDLSVENIYVLYDWPNSLACGIFKCMHDSEDSFSQQLGLCFDCLPLANIEPFYRCPVGIQRFITITNPCRYLLRCYILVNNLLSSKRILGLIIADECHLNILIS